jgi:hypothetical protein
MTSTGPCSVSEGFGAVRRQRRWASMVGGMRRSAPHTVPSGPSVLLRRAAPEVSYMAAKARDEAPGSEADLVGRIDSLIVSESLAVVRVELADQTGSGE